MRVWWSGHQAVGHGRPRRSTYPHATPSWRGQAYSEQARVPCGRRGATGAVGIGGATSFFQNGMASVRS